MFETLKWIGDIDGSLELIDQRILPTQFEMINCKTVLQTYDAIKTLAVRGAPAIGVAAAYGTVIAMQSAPANAALPDALIHLKQQSDYLASSRPTAVNLFWALNRINDHAQNFVDQNPNASWVRVSYQ